MTKRVHPAKLRIAYDMDQNGNHWDEGNTPDWSNTDFVRLNQLESLRSYQSFRFGVLTFNARSSDWDLCAGGFYLDSVNSVMFWADEFDAYKHSIHGGPEACGLTDDQWYHFIIIWNPQFVSCEIYEMDGTLAFYSKLRSTPNKTCDIFFYGLNGAVNFDIADVSVQGGDDSQFFLTKRDHVQCHQAIWAGATWSGSMILINSAGERAYGEGTIRQGYSRYRYRFTYVGNIAGNANVTIWIFSAPCDSTRTVDLNWTGNITVVTAWTVYHCWVSDWFPLNGLHHYVSGYIQWNSGPQLYISGITLEME